MAAKKKKKSKDKIFTDRPRKIFRNYIGSGEVWFGAGFVVFVAFMGIWFIAQEDNYDPGERDISMQVLIDQQVEDKLYKAPLKRWVDPAQAAVVGTAAGPNLAPFPSALAGNGWVDASRVQEFTDTTVYEKIDGQEAQYRAYGLVKAWFLSLAHEANGWDMGVEMYDMGNFTNTLGVFSAQRGSDNSAAVKIQDNCYYYETEIGVIGMVENYYFKLAGNAPEQGIVDHARLFIDEFVPTVDPSEDRPEFFTTLSEAFGFESIAFVLADAFQYEFCKEFWFVTPEAGGDLKYFVHDAASADDAAALFDQFAEEQSYEYEEVNRDGNAVTFKHEFLDTYFILVQDGTMIYGIEGAESADQATASLGKLKEVIGQ